MSSKTPASLLDHSLDAVPNVPDRHQPVGFILRLAKALHTYGVPAYELEHTITACAQKLGFGVQCLSLPTSITLTLMVSKDNIDTFVIRVTPGEIHLDKLRRVSDIAHQVMSDKLTVAEGAEALKQLNSEGALYSKGLQLLAFALVSASVSRLFGAGLNEVIVALFCGFCMGLLIALAEKVTFVNHLLPALSALSLSIFAHALSTVIPITSTTLCILSGLIILLPGLALTIAMTELATQHLMSGTARLFGATIVFILMAFGIVIGSQLANTWFPELTMLEHTKVVLPTWSEWVAVLFAVFSFSILFQSRVKDFGWIFLGCAVAFATVKYTSLFLNTSLSAFFGAVAVGAIANLISRFKAIPGAFMVIPGFIILVPGSIGFNSVMALLEDDILGAIQTAFQMSLVGISLISGLLISSLVTLPKSKRISTLDDESPMT